MNKEELRHDPVRDNIVKFIDYIQKEKEKVFSGLVAIIIIIGGFSYLSHTDNMQIKSASKIAGRGQTIYLNGDADEALVKFERVINDYPGTPGAVQSLVYLLNNAITNSDMEAVESLLKENSTSIKDPIVKAALYKLHGDLVLNDSPSEAARYYKRARDTSSENGYKLKYNIDLATAQIASESLEEAHVTLESVLDSDGIDFNTKNAAEELMAFVSYKLGI